MKLVTLVFLLSSFSLTLTEVVSNFEKCSKFFFRSISKNTIVTPAVFKGHQYKKICQLWKDRYRFATLYDMERRIPVYSAYTFTGQHKWVNLSLTENIRNNEWKNEPQLENIYNTPNMRMISKAEMDDFIHQAVNRDYAESKKYTGTEYTRGHVFPNQYAADQDQADSTFTFTNIAPQTKHSNGEWERKVETPMKKLIMSECKPSNNNPTYIVTGMVPGNKWIAITRKGKKKSEFIVKGVNIPSHFWTAFCCNISNKVRFSKAYLNVQNEPNYKTYEISEMSVNMLNVHLTRLFKQDFSIFSSWCLT